MFPCKRESNILSPSPLPSFIGSIGSGFNYLGKIIMLVFEGFTIRPSVIHHLRVMFRALSIRSLRAVRKCPL
jgi:hypothetical protein